jgi:hypothetical protein
MAQQFSYWPNVRNSGSHVCKIVFALFLLSSFAYGQTQPPPDKIKADIKTVQNAVNDVLGLSLPGWGVLQGAKGAYLEGYGIVLNAEVALDPPANPFSLQKSPEEVRTFSTQKSHEIQEKLVKLLKEKVPLLTSLAAADSVAIVLNVLNTNPAYMPDMPTQIIFSAKKQDSARVNIREFK